MQWSLTFGKFVKAPLIYSVSYFNLGSWSFFGWPEPTNASQW